MSQLGPETVSDGAATHCVAFLCRIITAIKMLNITFSFDLGSVQAQTAVHLLFHLCCQITVCRAYQDKSVSGQGCKKCANAVSDSQARTFWQIINHKFQQKGKKREKKKIQ